MIKQRVFYVGCLLLWVHGAVAELPQYSPEVHLGVASCASGVCHGSVRARNSTDVLQNEYVIWSRLDRHRNAYNTLLSSESARIARNLGYDNAAEADICLDCHADNVPVDKRGSRFQLSDGVGCEACHGGAEKYLNNHADPDVAHQRNLDDGLYPTDRIAERAALCFSCHIGSENKIASHEIMGAGHPRLSFELDTFGVLQPAHYVVDEDYSRDKWSGDSFTVWALGQVHAGEQLLELVQTRLDTGKAFPELSLFDCHSCHHPMSDKKWEPSRRTGLAPGSVRLNDAPFLMLFPVSRVFEPEVHDALHKDLQQLHQQIDKGDDLSAVISRLKASLARLGAAIGSSAATGSADRILGSLVSMGKAGMFRDYVAAEQAVMAIDMLLSSVGTRDEKSNWLDSLYDAVADEDHYRPDELTRLMADFSSET